MGIGFNPDLMRNSNLHKPSSVKGVLVVLSGLQLHNQICVGSVRGPCLSLFVYCSLHHLFNFLFQLCMYVLLTPILLMPLQLELTKQV